MIATTLDPSVDAEFARIVDELTRRGFLTGGLGSAALLGLAACGPSSSPTGNDSSSAPTTRLVDSVHGKIRVPADPKRIVSINQFDTTALLDLGVTPVGIFDFGIDYTAPRYRTKYAAIPKIGKTGVEVEKVAALKPDLILGYDIEFNNTVYTQMSAIAPTVIATNTGWQKTALQVADAANLGAAFAAEQAKYQQRCQAIRTQYADVLSRTTWDAVQGGFDTGACWVYGPQVGFLGVFADAGVQFGTATKAAADVGAGEVYQVLSYENLDRLSDADVIAYWSEYGSDKPVNDGPQLFAQQLWKDLPAVKAGRLVPVADVAMSSYGDALAVLDELETGLKKLESGTR